MIERGKSVSEIQLKDAYIQIKVINLKLVRVIECSYEYFER